MSDEHKYKHQWKNGEWFRREKDDRYMSREDLCEVCGCERSMVKYKQHGSVYERVVLYVRSKQFFNFMSPPDCWGAKNPQ